MIANVHNYAGEGDPEALLRRAIEFGGAVFIGVRLRDGEARDMLSRIEDAGHEGAGAAFVDRASATNLCHGNDGKSMSNGNALRPTPQPDVERASAATAPRSDTVPRKRRPSRARSRASPSDLIALALRPGRGPNILSLAHWERLDQGDLYAASSRVDWMSLLRRTFEVDLRVCGRCGGRLSIRSVITEPEHIEPLLAVLRRPRDPPAAA